MLLPEAGAKHELLFNKPATGERSLCIHLAIFVYFLKSKSTIADMEIMRKMAGTMVNPVWRN